MTESFNNCFFTTLLYFSDEILFWVSLANLKTRLFVLIDVFFFKVVMVTNYMKIEWIRSRSKFKILKKDLKLHVQWLKTTKIQKNESKLKVLIMNKHYTRTYFMWNIKIKSNKQANRRSFVTLSFKHIKTLPTRLLLGRSLRGELLQLRRKSRSHSTLHYFQSGFKAHTKHFARSC